MPVSSSATMLAGLLLGALTLGLGTAQKQQCVRTGSSPKCKEPDECCTFPANFTVFTWAL
jgi:hypothetical protein